MRFARWLAAAGVAAGAAGAGMFLLAPGIEGQARGDRVRAVSPKQAAVEVLHGGGSRIGVGIREVDQADVAREKLAGPAGAVIEDVAADSPAAKAGLKAGDVVLTFDGERVRSARQLERLVDETPAGRTVKMAVQRAGGRVELDVTPEASGFAWRDDGRFRFERFVGPRVERELRRHIPAMEFEWDGEAFAMFSGRGRLGVRVQELSGDLAAYFGVKAGVLVAEVEDESPAAKAGFKAGDVITAVDGRAVEDPTDLRREVARIDEGKAAEVNVTREKKGMTLSVEVEARARTFERRIRRTI